MSDAKYKTNFFFPRLKYTCDFVTIQCDIVYVRFVRVSLWIWYTRSNEEENDRWRARSRRGEKGMDNETMTGRKEERDMESREWRVAI